MLGRTPDPLFGQMTIEFPERFNMADYFLYHNVEEGRETKTCLYFEDQSYTYGDTARM